MTEDWNSRLWWRKKWRAEVILLASATSREDGDSSGVGDDAAEGSAGMSTDPSKEDEIGKGLFDGW